MKLLVAYSTTEGQTLRIARRIANHVTDQGHTCELLAVTDAGDPDFDRFDGAVLAASVHMNAYQRAMSDFAARFAHALNGLPTLFISVSLAAVGHDADDWQGLEKIGEDLSEATGWTPGRIVQVAGAYKPSKYDIFRGFVMRRIMSARDPDIDLGADQEFTDWKSLFSDIDMWLAAINEGADSEVSPSVKPADNVPA